MANARQARFHPRAFRTFGLSAAAGLLAVTGVTRVAAAQDVMALQARLAAEDARTSNADSLRILTGALDSPDSDVRASGARALGRFERIEFIDVLAAHVGDPSPRVREEVFNALAQIAHGQRRGASARVVEQVRDLLVPALSRERDPAVRGTIARSLGRIAGADSSGERIRQALAGLRHAGGLLASPAHVDDADPTELFGVLHASYNLARTTRPPPNRPTHVPDAVDLHLLRYGRGGAAKRASDDAAVRIRRLTMLTLNAAVVRADSTAALALADPDVQMRRLAVLAAPNVVDAGARRRLLVRALADSHFLVRMEAVRAWRRFLPSDCRPVAAAAHDAAPHVALAAIDALGGCEPSDEVRSVLASLVRPAPRQADRVSGRASWHTHAHAVVSLARVDAPAARQIVRDAVAHPIWQVRMYAARAAAVLRDTAVLWRLSDDAKGGVREAAIQGLSTVVGHAADSIFVQALASSEYHVVLAAANALRGTRAPGVVLPALLRTLVRLTSTGEDNSRDPRAAVLQRIGELGDRSSESVVERYLTDFDPAIAQQAAEIVTRWTGRSVAPAAVRIERVSSELARVATGSPIDLRITMAAASGGGRFVVRLRTEAAPATAQRLIELAERGYYDGLSFHRVEPAFVIQGGSPGATEYIGNSPFMRDEVDLASHVYGTVGISTRGRDTGDAQIFVNLADNFRLDHDYTVAGTVTEGMSVVDGILEGDVIERVTVTSYGAPEGRPR